MDALAVYLGGRRVATLAPADRPSDYLLSFERDVVAEREGEIVLSASLPVRAEQFTPTEARPFFEGLLPEGAMRERIAGSFKLSNDNSFGLLSRIGRDCAGAVVLLPEAVSLETDSSVEWLGDAELIDLVEQLPRRPLGVSGETKVRLSLAGLQRKAVLVRSPSGEFGLPNEGAPSTHLVKPQYADSEFEDLVANEHFCMRVAGSVGLDVARTDLIEIGGRPCLLVARYDRSVDGHSIVRLHQEDFCQALGVVPGLKYQAEGGPGLRQACALLRRVSFRSGADVLELLRSVVVNFVLGNSDAHAKNFALLYAERGLRLAPRYDIVSTAAYPDVEEALAMSIGDTVDPASLDDGDLLDLAEDCGLNYGQLVLEWERVATKTLECAERLRELAQAEGWHRPVVDRIIAAARTRARQLSDRSTAPAATGAKPHMGREAKRGALRVLTELDTISKTLSRAIDSRRWWDIRFAGLPADEWHAACDELGDALPRPAIEQIASAYTEADQVNKLANTAAANGGPAHAFDDPIRAELHGLAEDVEAARELLRRHRDEQGS